MVSLAVTSESRIRSLLGIGFGAGLASATVAAVAAPMELPAGWDTVMVVLGAAIGAAFSSLIVSYALSWRSAGLGVACGTVVGVAAQAVRSEWALVAACWLSSVVTSLVVHHERRDLIRLATSPRLVAMIHFLQLPLIAFSAAVSLVSPRPRPFVILYTISAFALWRLLGGDCPISRAEAELRALRGEQARGLRETGFVGHHLHRTTGVIIPSGSVSRFAYALAAMTFTWYLVEALL